MKNSSSDFLLIDAGNTRLKWAVADRNGAIRVAGDIATGAASPKAIASLARKYPNQTAILASVVPRILPAFQSAFSGRLIEVTTHLPHLGLRFQYPKPSELGADRIAAAVAVQKQTPAIIIACGTATAFTVVDAHGKLCGGAIAPGLQAQLDALLGATAQLPATDLRLPRHALAKSTRDAIRAGVMLNYRGGVKEILQALLKELPRRPAPKIILTGGNYPLLAKELGPRVKLRPLLIFEGLLMIGTRLGRSFSR